jgi:hypothetical protein
MERWLPGTRPVKVGTEPRPADAKNSRILGFANLRKWFYGRKSIPISNLAWSDPKVATEGIVAEMKL